jgi:hypothetical protein
MKKRKRGRPSKPLEYWSDLLGLRLRGQRKRLVVDCGGKRTVFTTGQNLLDACRKLFSKHRVVMWCDQRTGKPLYAIRDANTLRNRIMEARRRAPKRQWLGQNDWIISVGRISWTSWSTSSGNEPMKDHQIITSASNVTSFSTANTPRRTVLFLHRK